MLWECSECGGRLERTRAPRVCDGCGIAGAIFVPADESEPEPSALVTWLAPSTRREPRRRASHAH